MPRIFLKPKSPEYADKERSRAGGERPCDHPGCDKPAVSRSPKDRSLSEYYWFCAEHAEAYNRAWNYFEGMSAQEMEEQIIRSALGDRPTWTYARHGTADDILRRATWKTYHFTEKEPEDAQTDREHQYRSRHFSEDERRSPEYQAMAILGLEPPLTLEGIKKRYKELAKTHHPDRNPGNKEAEELLKSINMAYTILRSSYERFSDIEDRTT